MDRNFKLGMVSELEKEVMLDKKWYYYNQMMPGTATISLKDIKTKTVQTKSKIEHSRDLLELYSQNTNLGYIGSQVNANNIRIQEENLKTLYKELNYWNNYEAEYLRKNPDKTTYYNELKF